IFICLQVCASIGRIYTNPNTADIESKKPTFDKAVGDRKTKINAVKGNRILIELLLPKRSAKIEILLIKHALTIDGESPERTANNQITIRLRINLYFFGKKLKILLTNSESIVTLYPEAATIWLTPPILVASSNSLLNNLFCPNSIPANRDDCGSFKTLSTSSINLTFKSTRKFVKKLPSRLSDIESQEIEGFSTMK
ncbi:MAG TPA: hypothetical protein P5098_00580, partial [Candidatus Dojkabacteria bacterium]|nr:hypothetical protein [Candidatus Dojkabacteria bacterium]